MSFQNPEVLVTGGTGLVGSNLIDRLLSEGTPVKATLHKKRPVVLDDRIQYLDCDLTKGEDCRRAVQGVRRVFHCAANTSGAGTMAATPMVHVTPNVLINSQLLEAAYDAKVEKFLWLSSTTGYPDTGERPVKEEEMFDGEPFETYYFVGWMKRFTELLCRMYGEKLADPMVTIVLRPTNIYGPRDDFEFATSHVTAAVIRKVIERWAPVEVWGTGEDLKDVLYVDDMVEAMVAAMERVESHQTFNIGFEEAYSIKEILQTVLDVDGYSGAQVAFDESKPSMIPARLVDISKARDLLGFRPKISLKDGIRRTVEWYRKTNDLPRAAVRSAR